MLRPPRPTTSSAPRARGRAAAAALVGLLGCGDAGRDLLVRPTTDCPRKAQFDFEASTHGFATIPCCRLGLTRLRVDVGHPFCGRAALAGDADFRPEGRDFMGSPEYLGGEIIAPLPAIADLQRRRVWARMYFEGPAALPPNMAVMFQLIDDEGIYSPRGFVKVPAANAWFTPAVTLELDPPPGGSGGRLSRTERIGFAVLMDEPGWKGTIYVDDFGWE